MKKILTLILITALIIITAGCINDEPDPIIGTWKNYDYTNTAGTHYVDVTDIFYEDNSGLEMGITDDGSHTNWDFLWFNKGDYYVAFYSPMILYLDEGGQSGVVNSDNSAFENWEFIRTEGSGSNIVGKWQSKTDYLYIGYMSSVTGEINSDGTGSLVLSNELGKFTLPLNWTEIGEGAYIIASSSSMEFRITEDGKMVDNYGFEYTKE